jgi:murein DD-endopeptidase MepM/ murein hydrolase activator NlpD
MKQWTVMLVPHDRGSTRQLEMGMPHVWMASGLVIALVLTAAALAFASSYIYKRHQVSLQELRAIQMENRGLAQEANNRPVLVTDGMTDEEREATERELRQKYEASTRAIAEELSELYEMEAQIREVHGLPPRTNSAADYVSTGINAQGGQGGAPGVMGSVADILPDNPVRPPQVIYGLANPSADLILQEIQLRRSSLEELYGDMLAVRDRVERMPADWPVKSRSRRISSRFGYRRDPFTPTVRHHDGLDIAAPHGTKVYATGRGKITGSGYERYLGHTVRISHGDGYETVYAHLSSRLVSVGEEVNRGDVIGKIGSSGRSTGPHLHYEVRQNGRSRNPENFLP